LAGSRTLRKPNAIEDVTGQLNFSIAGFEVLEAYLGPPVKLRYLSDPVFVWHQVPHAHSVVGFFPNVSSEFTMPTHHGSQSGGHGAAFPP